MAAGARAVVAVEVTRVAAVTLVAAEVTATGNLIDILTSSLRPEQAPPGESGPSFCLRGVG